MSTPPGTPIAFDFDEAEDAERPDDLASEQRHLDIAYARLEEMRSAAERVAEGFNEVRGGGTHQARVERDAAHAITRRRLAALEIGDAALCFGRIDRRPELGADELTFYIGRLAVTAEDQTPLVVDWRAPVAEPFYRATAVEPMGVARRRHFQCRGRTLLAIDDEVFDEATVERQGLTVVGEGALLAALDRDRTGRMGDIVATIQAEQDEAIRADMDCVLIVRGGPGTGKTAVALHRAAYLLYSNRRKLASAGVLLVGPSSVFLRYIDEVLPALGEDEVQLSTVRALKPSLRTAGPEVSEIAVLKGDLRMTRVLRRAMTDRERRLPHDLRFEIDGYRITISRSDSARILERVRRRRATHNERRPMVVRSLMDRLVAKYRDAVVRAYRHGSERLAHNQQVSLLPEPDDASLSIPDDPTLAASLARGEGFPPDFEADLRVRLRGVPEVREALERMWPILSGAELVHDLFSFPALIRSASQGELTPAEQAMLHRPRATRLELVAWTEADLALVDEADELLGPVQSALPAKPRRRGATRGELDAADSVVRELGLEGQISAADVVERFGGSTVDGDGSGEPRTYGHVLVDEAQDLTPMQWRMLSRRVPSGSMTIVGDIGQASRPGSARSWDEVIDAIGSRLPARSATLTVNYRTPAEIMEVAHRVLAVASPELEPTEAVRHTGVHPRFDRVEPDELVAAVARAARRGYMAQGTVAVVAEPDLHAPIVAALADLGAVGDVDAAIEARVAVLSAPDTKGLEFDHVVVVEPARLVPSPDRAGLRLLYVTLTRATRTLTVLHAEPLPESLHP